MESDTPTVKAGETTYIEALASLMRLDPDTSDFIHLNRSVGPADSPAARLRSLVSSLKRIHQTDLEQKRLKMFERVFRQSSTTKYHFFHKKYHLQVHGDPEEVQRP